MYFGLIGLFANCSIKEIDKACLLDSGQIELIIESDIAQQNLIDSISCIRKLSVAHDSILSTATWNNFTNYLGEYQNYIQKEAKEFRVRKDLNLREDFVTSLRYFQPTLEHLDNPDFEGLLNMRWKYIKSALSQHRIFYESVKDSIEWHHTRCMEEHIKIVKASYAVYGIEINHWAHFDSTYVVEYFDEGKAKVIGGYIAYPQPDSIRTFVIPGLHDHPNSYY